MTYPRRTIPAAGLAAEQDWWSTHSLDTTQKVVVYWPDTDDLTLVGYYDTVSEAKAAATANINGQRKPWVKINWGHIDITHYSVGAVQHRRASNADGAIALPDWIDDDPMP